MKTAGGMTMLDRLFTAGFPNTPDVERAPVYFSDKVVVFQAGALIAQMTGLPCAYSFLIAGQESLSVELEGRAPLVLGSGFLLAINAGQRHMGAEDRQVKEYLSMFVDRDFLSELAYQVWGRRQVSFANDSRPIVERGLWVIHEFMDAAVASAGRPSPNLSSLDYELALRLMRWAGPPLPEGQGTPEKKLVARIEEYLRDSLSSQISLDELARLVNYSPYHVIRLFRQATGSTPMAFLLSLRIQKAQRLLRETDLTISAISQECGFESPSYFSAAFRRETGYSPSAYRRLL